MWKIGGWIGESEESKEVVHVLLSAKKVREIERYPDS